MKLENRKWLKVILLLLGAIIMCPIPFIRNKLLDIFLMDREIQDKMEEIVSQKNFDNVLKRGEKNGRNG